MIFISYYTVETPYENVINKYLIPSLKKWNLQHDILGIRDLGDWQANTGFKSKFIKTMLELHKQDVCFLDADASIEEYPTKIFGVPDICDVAVHWLDWFKFWRNQDNNPHREMLSGTMVVKYKDNAFKLLDEWINQVQVLKNIKEQKVLEQILLQNKQYTYYNLPVSYCAIKKFDGSIPEYVGDPVILHHQVSRQYKNRNKSDNWNK